MKRYGLLFVTAVTLFLTGLTLARAGWLHLPSSPSDRPARLKAHVRTDLHDALASEAALRWRRCQPTHWRACILQR